MEFSWCGNEYVNAILSLIHDKRCKVAFIGDYAKEPFRDSKNFYASVMPKEVYEKHYESIWSKDRGLRVPTYQSDDMLVNLLDKNTVGMYLVNHDKCEYIDIAVYIESSKIFRDGFCWVINPLPLLTACGNGLGGGDYYAENASSNDVGVWAFDTLEYTGNAPWNYVQVEFIFKLDEQEAGASNE